MGGTKNRSGCYFICCQTIRLPELYVSSLFARTAFTAVALIGLVGLASAQYIGPGTTRPPSSLTALLQNPTEGLGVQLRGRLLRRLNQTKYMFTDGKSEIRVQITDELFPKQVIDERTEIEIVGRVEKEYLESPEIDVSSILILTAESAKTPRQVDGGFTTFNP